MSSAISGLFCSKRINGAFGLFDRTDERRARTEIRAKKSVEEKELKRDKDERKK